jgi:hypothetical protein
MTFGTENAKSQHTELKISQAAFNVQGVKHFSFEFYFKKEKREELYAFAILECVLVRGLICDVKCLSNPHFFFCVGGQLPVSLSLCHFLFV